MEKLKILFIYPNYAYVGIGPCVGIACLAGAMKNKGFEFDLFDTSFILKVPELEDYSSAFKVHASPDGVVPKELDEVIDDFKKDYDLSSYDIVLVSTLTRTHELGRALINVVKEANPSAFVIVGGIHPTVAPERTIIEEGIDAICIGEGEEGLVELLERKVSGKPFTDVKGFWFKINGEIHRNELAPNKEMDDLLLPDYSIFRSDHFYTAFVGKIYKTLTVEISRGCLYKCAYCVNKYLQDLYDGVSDHHRKHTVEGAVNKLKRLVEIYKPEMLRFVDESFSFMSKPYFKELAQRYSDEIGLPFVLQTNANTLKEESVKNFKKMNCVAISIGVEHGDEKFRFEVLDKRLKDHHIYEALELLKKYKIRTTAYFLLGFPFETRENVFSSVRMNKLLIEKYNVAPSSISCFFPYPGTPLLEVCEKNGFLAKNIDTTAGVNLPALDMPQLSYQEILGLKRTFFAYSIMPEKYYPIIKQCEEKSEFADKILELIMEANKN